MYKFIIAILLFFTMSFSQKFQVALIPDTQMAIESCPSTNDSQFSWIASHKDSLGLKYVISLGDITNDNTVKEWQSASHAYSYVDKVFLPTIYAPGNHDGPSTYARFNSTFTETRIDSVLRKVSYIRNHAYYPIGLTSNSYTNFDIGINRYTIIALQCSAGSFPDVIAWANQVCAVNSDRRIILATHAYQDDKGVKLAEGQKIWNSLINKHNNIFLVVCGHYTGESCVKTKTSLGNTVTQMLIDLQNGNVCGYQNSVTRLLEFNTANDSVKATTFAVVGKRFMTGSKDNFSFSLDFGKTSVLNLVQNKPIHIKSKSIVYDLLGRSCQRTQTGIYLHRSISSNKFEFVPPNFK